MKKIIVILILAAGFAALGAQEKPIVLVAPVSSEVLEETERRLIQDAVVHVVMTSEEYLVVSEEGRALALEEIRHSLSGFFTEATALDAGKLVDADFVLAVSVGRLGSGRVWAALRMIDVRSGNLARAASREYADLSDMPVRVSDLVSRTLSLKEPKKDMAEGGEMIFLPPAAHRVRAGLTLGACFFEQHTELQRAIEISSLSLGSYSIYGRRPLGLYLHANFFHLLNLSINGEDQAWLGAEGYPWGLNFHIGPNLNIPLGEAVSFDLRGGLGYTQFILYPVWKSDLNLEGPMFDPTGGEYLSTLIWNYGVFAGLSLNIRLSPHTYLVLGCDASYEFGEFLPGFNIDDALVKAWSITPLISLIQGK